jgi:hypothetical protein
MTSSKQSGLNNMQAKSDKTTNQYLHLSAKLKKHLLISFKLIIACVNIKPNVPDISSDSC